MNVMVSQSITRHQIQIFSEYLPFTLNLSSSIFAVVNWRLRYVEP